MKLIWSTLRDLLPLLPSGAQGYFVRYMIVSSALTILDVLAMGLLAIVIAPALNGTDIKVPIIGTLDSSASPGLILVACFLILLKSALSVLLHWFATKRFARYELEIGERLFRAYVHSTWEERSKRSVAEITRIADAGIGSTVAGFILPLTRVPASITTFVLILGVLLVADPLTSVIALVYLAIVAAIVNQVVTRRALEAGQVNVDYTYRVAILMTEMVEALKELSLRNKLDQVADLVTANRVHSVRARRNGSFLQIIPVYSIEAALVGGFLLIGGAAYLTSGLAGAAAAVALFAATGFRLIPAINAIQASIVQAGATRPFAMDVINDLKGAESSVAEAPRSDSAVLPAEPQMLRLESVRFRYPTAQSDVINGLDLDIPLGSSLGIVGPSGAGKSTLIDLILGLSVPSSGAVTIDGQPLNDVLRAWRDRVGYVPQRVALFDASVAQNVALTWDDDFDADRVRDVLKRAQLTSLVSSRRGGINERIGERGMSLSGGQQQRLGIARALYADPLILVLDEATSSLDTKTEDEVTQAIRTLRGDITLISVAHRLSTIKDYDQICYIEDGQVVGKGTFSQVALQLPTFGEQVALAGLARDAGLLAAVVEDGTGAADKAPEQVRDGSRS
ncbi:MAG: ABC transporter ATP-binding protein [Rhodoglobus sp.]